MNAENIAQMFMGVSTIGSATKSFGMYEKGREEQKAYEYNAAVSLEEMERRRESTQAEYEAMMGRQTTLYAAAGVGVGSGSPEVIRRHTEAEKEQEMYDITRAGTREAELQRYYGKMARYSGTTGAISSFLTDLGQTGLRYQYTKAMPRYGYYG